MRSKLLLIYIILILLPHPVVLAQTSEKTFTSDSLYATYKTGELTLSKNGWNTTLTLTGFGSPTETLYEDKVVLDYSFASVEIYKEAIGFEYMVILPDRPANPRISLPVISEGLTWYYQPALNLELVGEEYTGWTINETHAYDENGVLRDYRPLNVVGSYAIYGEYCDGLYGTGKFTHVYRPYVYDSNGVGYYADMIYEDGYLHIDLDGVWLKDKKRTYPVYVDPTFGYTTIGGSSGSYYSGSYAYSNGPYTLAENGTAVQINVYGSTNIATTLKTAIYDDNAGTPNNLQVVSTATNMNALQWYTFSIADTPIVSTSKYHIAVGDGGGGTYTYYYDSVSGYSLKYSSGKAFDDPWVNNGTPSTSRRMSWYVNYTTTPDNPPTGGAITYNTTHIFYPCGFSCNITDDVGLSHYIFSWNKSGVFVNSSAVAIGGNTSYTMLTVYDLPAVNGTRVDYTVYFNDTKDAWGFSSGYLVTTDTVGGASTGFPFILLAIIVFFLAIGFRS